jgi:hypothetical protein
MVGWLLGLFQWALGTEDATEQQLLSMSFPTDAPAVELKDALDRLARLQLSGRDYPRLQKWIDNTLSTLDVTVWALFKD